MRTPILTSLIFSISIACSSSEDGSEPNDPSAAGAGGTTPDAGGGAGGAVTDPVPDGPQPSPVPDDCIQDVTPGSQKIDCDGVVFDLAVPDVCLDEACGLIVDVHGFGMNGAIQEQHSRLTENGNAAGYIVVQPNAPGQVPATSWDGTQDAIILDFMQRVMAAWHTDPKRVHFGGFSQGGYMTWRFVCANADIIASAAPAAAGTSMASDFAESCAFSGEEIPARELPIFFMHGTIDEFVSFDTAVAQRDAVIAAWNLQSSEMVASGPDYSRTRYTNDSGTVFEFIQHDWETDLVLGTPLVGHCFPGSGDFATGLGDFIGCGTSNPFHWGEEVLQFYIDHPMD